MLVTKLNPFTAVTQQHSNLFPMWRYLSQFSRHTACIYLSHCPTKQQFTHFLSHNPHPQHGLWHCTNLSYSTMLNYQYPIGLEETHQKEIPWGSPGIWISHFECWFLTKWQESNNIQLLPLSHFLPLGNIQQLAKAPLWEISHANCLIHKAWLIATNTNKDELVADNIYLIVDSFVWYFVVNGKRRILPWQNANSWLTTPVGPLSIALYSNKIKNNLPVCMYVCMHVCRRFFMEPKIILASVGICLPASECPTWICTDDWIEW